MTSNKLLTTFNPAFRKDSKLQDGLLKRLRGNSLVQRVIHKAFLPFALTLHLFRDRVTYKTIARRPLSENIRRSSP